MSHQLTKQQALAIIEAHDINNVLNDEEEVELLEGQNPEMLEAYRVLKLISLED